MKIALYAHGGSRNHGCEALVRSGIKAIGTSHNSFRIISERPQEDYEYQLDNIASIQGATEPLSEGLAGFLYKIKMKLFKDDRIYYKNVYRSFIKHIEGVEWALAIGGDNYCYKGFLEQFGVLNDMLAKNHIPSALWGCSIDPERINDAMLSDLRKYQFITARESITYHALQAHHLPNIQLIPDTAFILDKIEKSLPQGFQPGNTVGINLSPLISKYEKEEGLTFANYNALIDFILHHTQFTIALIPHVVWDTNDDRIPLELLYKKYKNTERVVFIEDANAMELKGYIARCRFLIAARTHASIAGYSTGVPTLVVGYSVKARGIARDLFGTDHNYVLPVDCLTDKDDLTISFKWLMKNEDRIRNHYSDHLDAYVSRLKLIDGLFK